MNNNEKDINIPPQHQDEIPGKTEKMQPKPVAEDKEYKSAGKLKDKVALITGGDSGIGQAVAITYVKEGAKTAIVYLNEHEDAKNTEKIINDCGGECLLIAGDIGDEDFCKSATEKTMQRFGKIDILVNNAAEHFPAKSIMDISAEQLEKTYRTNIFSMFYMTKAVLNHFKDCGIIINTTSVVSYKGSSMLLDYSSTKGAVTTFTRSLSLSLVNKNIRVNAVAPGPIWTPLIPSSFEESEVEQFGKDTPMKRAGQPCEVAPAYVFLASKDSSYITGQVIHVNGGTIVGS